MDNISTISGNCRELLSTDNATVTLNRKISQLQGWRMEVLSNGCYWHSPRCTYNASKRNCDLASSGCGILHPDWLSSDKANCVLLDEMPMPHVWKNPDGTWHCDPFIGSEDEKDISANDANRRTVIALAWLKWKGVDCA